GTLTYTNGINHFSGPVITGGATPLTGNATGRFYGPSVEEIGGVYSLSGTGLSRMLGGFGGKR
ncbi:MAG TPA: hypothetical protein VFX09_05000, partial [Burkholderiales bacterium]|nr:hypothetical protein [Burkholderiales bacterium]